jgi:uncharacterized radical SAM superfamily Fe-S cluster-containing enzyme
MMAYVTWHGMSATCHLLSVIVTFHSAKGVVMLVAGRARRLGVRWAFLMVTEVADQQAAAPVTFLELEITGKCQLKCVHCYADSGPAGTHGTITARDWERLIDDAAAMGVRTVQFIGGEPTLYPELPRLVRHAVAAGLGVEVFSNLVRVTPAQWAVFALPGVSLATSYYGDTAVAMRR